MAKQSVVCLLQQFQVACFTDWVCSIRQSKRPHRPIRLGLPAVPPLPSSHAFARKAFTMPTVRSHLVNILLSLLIAAAIAWLLGGITALFAATAAVCAFWLVRHLIYLIRLSRWLANPKPRLIPQGSGVWQEVFDTLLRQSKSRKKRKQKISEALQRANRIAEAMPNGVIVLNQEGRIEWMNRLSAEHLNLNETDCGGMLSNLIRLPEFHRFLQRPLDGGTPILKLPLPDCKQRQRTLQLTRTPFDGGAQLLVSQDISAAEQLNATRTAFVANVSHELRTPLTVINGFLETMADLPDLPSEQQREFIGLMRQEGARMQDLLTDLLTLSRLESRQGSDDERAEVNLSELCRQTGEAARALSAGRHEFDIDIDSGISINGVARDLYSALSNIAFNAVRYTPEGGRICISLCRQSDESGRLQACFAVSDTGPGIPAEHLPHLTERFYRVDAGRNRRSGGTGLGLAITKHALAEHQAERHIRSTVGEGSTFSTFFLLE